MNPSVAQLLGLDAFPIEQIIEALHDGVVVIDSDGMIVYANSAYTRILNVPVNRVLGRNMREVQPEARGLRVLETGQPVLRDAFYLKELGADVVISATPIFKDSTIVGAVTIFRTSEELLELYGAYRRAHGLADYYKSLSTPNNGVEGFAEVVGRSPAILECVRLANLVAQTDATVLLTGENGTGKEVFAQSIHKASKRSNKPFIAVNSGAIPDSLLESELFGFDSGSFTGAAKGGKLGKFELAHHGTLFLDEVGDMSQAMQAKLLRALQNHEIEKIGGTRVVRVDVRVIAATNANLEEKIADGSFREDLFYRLNVFPIRLPMLDERRDDIPRLAQHFLNQFCNLYQKRIVLPPDSLEALQNANWLGNVRQLRNVIERAVIVSDGGVLMPEDFRNWLQPSQDQDRPSARSSPGLEDEINALKRKAYETAIALNGGNKSKAMAQLGVSRRTFYKHLRDLGIR